MRHSLSVFLLVLPLAALAQSPLTETEALRLGLSRGALSDLDRGNLDAAEADAQTAGLIPNPIFDYSRDQVRGSGGAVEQSLRLAQTFDISGRRELRKDAAGRRVEAVALGNTARRAEIAAEIRRRFYETLMKQETVRASETWATRFARIESIVQKLARAGEASGYDSRRLARERDAARARVAIESAELDRARERLSALVGTPGPEGGAVAGDLLPPAIAPIAIALGQLDQRPDLQALSRRAEAADLEGRASALRRIPDLTVGIGPKWTDSFSGNTNAMMLTLSVPLPIFDSGQSGQKRANAEALSARAEFRLARDRAEGELRGLHRQVERLRLAAADYRGRAVTASPELLRIAESAYRGGESSILELLDAYRGTLESELTALELERKAREARIEYDLQTGSAQ